MRRVSLGLSVFNIVCVSRVNEYLFIFLLRALGFVLGCGGNDGMEGCRISLYMCIYMYVTCLVIVASFVVTFFHLFLQIIT